MSSHRTLQRVLVRMLYDPQFCDAVYADPGRALAGLDLGEAELGWLAAVDRRAWGTDPLRRARSLTGLLEEFPASAALASGTLGSVGALERYFASEAFHHGCVQARGSMALSFARWLRETVARGEPRVGAVAALEEAIARVRRAPLLAPASGERLGLSPLAEPAAVPGGTLALYQDLLRRLAAIDADPVAALVHPRRGRLRAPRPLRRGEVEHLLAVRDRATGAVRIEELPAALAGLLEAARTPRPRAELGAEALKLGADPGEELEIVDGLVADGLLEAR